MKIVETSKWHCVGEIIDKNPPVKEIDPKFFDKVRKMYKDLQDKKDAVLAAKAAERREKIKEMRKKAQEEARAKIAAEKLAKANANLEPPTSVIEEKPQA